MFDAIAPSKDVDGVTSASFAAMSFREPAFASCTPAGIMALLEENLAGADLELEAAATARLDEVSAPRPDDYPYGPLGEQQRGRYVDSSEQVIRELS